MDGNANVFIGMRAGQNLTTGIGNTFIGFQAGQNSINPSTLNNNTLLDYNTKAISFFGALFPLSHATAIGADAVAQFSNEIVLGTKSDEVRTMGDLHVGVGNAGNTLYTDNLFLSPNGGGNSSSLCLVGNPGLIAFCSSSLRYKTNLAPYNRGFDVINRLRPITFDWKSDGKQDLGFGAEDVEKIDPLLVTYNKTGQVEGVKYDRITAVLVNAVKEQQEQIKLQQNQIERLKKVVCLRNRRAAVCK